MVYKDGKPGDWVVDTNSAQPIIMIRKININVSHMAITTNCAKPVSIICQTFVKYLRKAPDKCVVTICQIVKIPSFSELFNAIAPCS